MLHIPLSAVSRFHDYCFHSREIIDGRIEQTCLFILEIAGKSYIIQAIPDMEMSYGRTKYMACIMECQFHVRTYICDIPIIQCYGMFENFTDHNRFIGGFLSLTCGNIDIIQLK